MRLLRPLITALVVALTMSWAWRARLWVDGMDADSPPWRDMGPGMGPPPLEPLTGMAVATIALTVIGVMLTSRRPLPGYLVGAAGMLAFAVAGGPASGLLVPALVLAIGLLRSLGLHAAAPWWGLLPLTFWATWWDTPNLGLTDWRMWSKAMGLSVWVLVPTLFVALAMTRRQTRARERVEAIERAASDERLRLAREIHDVVGHSLSMISLQSGVALRVLDANPAQARASLEAIRSSSKDALAELRQTLGVFRGDAETPFAPTPTIEAIARLVDEVRAGGVRVDLTPLPDTSRVSAASQAAAFRIVQESLTNAVRHAPGQRRAHVPRRRSQRPNRQPVRGVRPPHRRRRAARHA